MCIILVREKKHKNALYSFLNHHHSFGGGDGGGWQCGNERADVLVGEATNESTDLFFNNRIFIQIQIDKI